jgi:hypothetical protein
MKPEDVVEIKQRISEFSELEKNWDTYGAIPLDIMAIDMAKCFIYDLFCAHPEIIKPYVFPSKEGGVQFEWDFVADEKVVSAVEFEIRIEDGYIVHDWLICPKEEDHSTWTEVEGYAGNPIECEAIQRVVEWSAEYEDLR